MGKVLSGGGTGSGNTTSLFTIPVGQLTRVSGVETPIMMRSAGTVSRLAGSVDAGGTTRGIRVRKNSANGNGILSFSSGIQTLYDSSNTDSFAAADTFGINLTCATTTPTWNWVSFLFDATGASIGFCATGAQQTSGTVYKPLQGIIDGTDSSTTEAMAQCLMRSSGTIQNCAVIQLTGSGSGTNIWKIRKGGVDSGISISIGATQTGRFEDTTHTCSFVSGDLVCWTLSGQSGAPSGTQHAYCAISYSASDFELFSHCTLSTSASDRYLPIIAGGGGLTTSEAIHKAQCGVDGSLKKLRAYVAFTGLSTSATIRVRKNGVDGNNVITLTNATTGRFEDTSNTDSFISTDDINYVVRSATAGSTTYLSEIQLTVARTDVVIWQGTAVLAAAATVPVNALDYSPAFATLAATSTLAVDASYWYNTATVVLASTSTLAVDTKIIPAAYAVLPATSTITADTKWIQQANALWNATSTLAADSKLYRPTSALWNTTSALIVGTIQAFAAKTVLASTSTFAADSQLYRVAAATLASTSSLIATGIQQAPVTAVLIATSGLVGNALVYRVAAAVLSSISTLTAKGQIYSQATALLGATSDFAIQGTVPSQPNLWQALATFALQASVAANTNQICLATAALPLNSVVLATASLRLPASALLNTTSTLAVDTSQRFLYQASSAWPLTSSLIASVSLRQVARAVLAATSALTADANIRGQITCDAALPLSSSLTAQSNIRKTTSAVLTATSSLAADSGIYKPANASLVLISSLAANSIPYKSTSSALIGASTLRADATVYPLILATAALAPTANVRADATVRLLILGTATVAGTTTLTTNTLVTHQLVGTAGLSLASDLRANASPMIVATAVLAVTSGWSASSIQRILWQTTAVFNVTSTLAASAQRYQQAQAVYPLAASITASITQRWLALARLIGSSTITTSSNLRTQIAAKLPLASSLLSHVSVSPISASLPINLELLVDASVHVRPQPNWQRKVQLQGSKVNPQLRGQVGIRPNLNANI